VRRPMQRQNAHELLLQMSQHLVAQVNVLSDCLDHELSGRLAHRWRARSAPARRGLWLTVAVPGRVISGALHLLLQLVRTRKTPCVKLLQLTLREWLGHRVSRGSRLQTWSGVCKVLVVARLERVTVARVCGVSRSPARNPTRVQRYVLSDTRSKGALVQRVVQLQLHQKPLLVMAPAPTKLRCPPHWRTSSAPQEASVSHPFI
jgi:hypothetical protein